MEGERLVNFELIWLNRHIMLAEYEGHEGFAEALRAELQKMSEREFASQAIAAR